MIDQSWQYYNGDLLGFVLQPKRQERVGDAQPRHRTTRSAIAFLVRMERAIAFRTSHSTRSGDTWVGLRLRTEQKVGFIVALH